MSAIDATVVQIRAAFGEAATHDLFKRLVRSFMRLDIDHPRVRARYGARLAMLRPYSLDDAIGLVERSYRDERKAFQISSIFGGGRCRLSIEVLRELRLMLRWSRRHDPAAYYAAHLAIMCRAVAS